MRFLAMGLLGAASLCAQHHRFSWQEACFKNPAAPYCPGHEYFSKHPMKPSKEGGTPVAGAASIPFPPDEVTPSVIVVGGIDWRFADPLADALVGFNLSGLAASPIARTLIAQLAAGPDPAGADVQDMFKRLCSVDQIAISVHENRIVAMIVGGVAGSTVNAADAGWKALALSQNVMLIGPAGDVDEAAQRIAKKLAPPPLARLASDPRQGNSALWAIASAGLAGPPAVAAGVKQFALAFTIRERLRSDLTLQFEGTPSTGALRLWPSGGDVALEDNGIHVRTSTEAGELPQRLREIAASPLGQGVAALINIAQYLPLRDGNVSSRTKPVIYGLDDGPK